MSRSEMLTAAFMIWLAISVAGISAERKLTTIIELLRDIKQGRRDF